MKVLLSIFAALLLSTAALAQITVDPVVADIKSYDSPSGDKNETRIAREVRHELLMIPYYSLFDDLGFTVRGSKVELTGAVNDGAIISEATSAVKRIEGVTDVVNNIKMLPPAPEDARIRHEAARRIFSTDGLSRYSWEAAPSIHIIVDRSRIRLVGYVLDEADKNMAGIAANQVPGVFNVQNDLQVQKR
jgi:hyperosmotically inducible protein